MVSYFVSYHLCAVVLAALVEDEEMKRHLMAEAKLRLITMSDEELREMARLCDPENYEQVYDWYTEVVDQLKTSSGWIKELVC